MAVKGKNTEESFFFYKKKFTNFYAYKTRILPNFSNNRFLMFLSFLVDIFKFANFIIPARQGKEINMLHCHEKLKAFNMKLSLWHTKLDKKNFAPFPHLNELLDGN